MKIMSMKSLTSLRNTDEKFLKKILAHEKQQYIREIVHFEKV